MSRDSARIGMLVRKAREEQGYTQEALANAAGATASTIRRIETGRFEGRPYSLPRILRALNLDLVTLAPSTELAADDNDVPRTFEEATRRGPDGKVDLDRLERYVQANRRKLGRQYEALMAFIANKRRLWAQQEAMWERDRQDLLEAVEGAFADVDEK